MRCDGLRTRDWLRCLTLLSLLWADLPAAGQSTVVSDTDVGIEGLELFGDGLIFWSSGDCSEIFSEGGVRLRPRISSATRKIERGCSVNQGGSNAVRDEAWVYYVHERDIMRKPVGASEATPEQVVDTAPYSPSLLTNFGSPLDVFEGDLYWVRFNDQTSNYAIMRKPLDGSEPAAAMVTGNGQKPTKLVATRYGSGDTFVLLWIEGNGDLWARRYGPLISTNRIGQRVSDFAVHSTSSFVIGSGQVVTSYAYLAIGSHQGGPPGRVDRVNLASLAATTLYTAPGDNQILSIATDSDTSSFGFANAYIMEGAVSCGGIFCSVTDVFARRRRIVGVGPTTWQLILATGGGGSLQSDDQYIYWADGTRIRRLATDAPAIEIDWEAMQVEVVQNTQTLTQAVRMVAGKQTFARGYARAKKNTSGVTIPVTAWLRGFRSNVELPGSPLQSLNAVNLPNSIQQIDQLRGDLTRSLLWELPDAWTAEGDLTVRLEIDGTQATPETGPTSNNNVNSMAPAQFRRRGRPCIKHRPVWISGAPFYNAETDGFLADMQRRATSLLPVEGFRSLYTSDPIVEPELTVEIECEVCFPLICCAPVPQFVDGPFEFPGDKDEDDSGEVLFRTSLWSEFTSDPDHCDADIHYLATVHRDLPGCVDGDPDTSCFNGRAYLDSDDLVVRMERDAAGLDAWNAPLGGRTFAHELGHNYDRQHVDCNDPDGPFDSPPFDTCVFGVGTPNGADAHFGFDPITQTVIAPGDAADLLTYRRERWISAWQWDALWAKTSTQGSQAGLPAPQGRHVLVSGRVDPTSGAAELLPLFVLDEGSYDAAKVARSLDAAAALGGGAPWRLQVRDAGGAVLVDLGALLRTGSDEPTEDPGGFVQYLPFPAEAAAVVVLSEGAVRAETAASASAPLLALDPVALDTVDGLLSVSWSASDADGDPLLFAVHYSADDGASWQVLRVHYSALSATFDTSLLPGSTRARVRVLATDGFHTSEAVSPPFVLPDHAPVVRIGGVADGAVLPFGSDPDLLGLGFDAEDGSLPDDALTWDDDVAPVGEGPVLPLRDLVPGSYAFNLTGADADGREGSARVEFSVDPVVVPDTAAPMLDGTCGDGAYAASEPIRVPFTNGEHFIARLVRGGDDLYLCAVDLYLPVISTSPQVLTARFELDGLGDTSPEPTDRGFRVDDQGTPSQEKVGRTGVFAVSNLPDAGYAARIERGPRGWSAELRIAGDLLGGWDHTVRMVLFHSSASWPFQANVSSPAEWGDVVLGPTAPAPPDRAPVARTGADLVVDLARPREVQLDGTPSFDPDGDGLLYAWTQIAGPGVALAGSQTALPEFVLQPGDAPGTYAFELIVDDGDLASDPAVQRVHVRAADPAPRGAVGMPPIPPLVTVGDPGNDPDPDRGHGAVASVYQVGTTEVTNAQYVLFLNAVAASDPFGLWDESMGDDPRGGIARSGSAGSYSYAPRPMMANKPVNFVDWFDAARYVNWLENGTPTGAAGPTTTEDGAYDLSQATPSRKAGANWHLGSEDEWFKAAYHDPTSGSGWRSWATAADVVPQAATTDGAGNVGNAGPATANYGNVAAWNTVDGHVTSVASTLARSYWGTYDQSGNVREWTDTLESGNKGILVAVARGGGFASDVDRISADVRERFRLDRPDAITGFRLFVGSYEVEPDADGDGIGDASDNCPAEANAAQSDADADGRGDACECGDASGDGFVNSVDARLIQRCAVGLFPCPALCDTSGEGTCNSVDARLVQRFAVGLFGKDALRCEQHAGP